MIQLISIPFDSICRDKSKKPLATQVGKGLPLDVQSVLDGRLAYLVKLMSLESGWGWAFVLQLHSAPATASREF